MLLLQAQAEATMNYPGAAHHGRRPYMVSSIPRHSPPSAVTTLLFCNVNHAPADTSWILCRKSLAAAIHKTTPGGCGGWQLAAQHKPVIKAGNCSTLESLSADKIRKRCTVRLSCV